MGDSKRRKQQDPNYGDNCLFQPEVINYCNSIIAQESVSTVLDFWANAGDIKLEIKNIDDLDGRELCAYNIARQKTAIDLGICRQQEQSLGYLSLMDRHFRSKVLHMNDRNSGDFIFNWYTEQDIKKMYKIYRNRTKGKGLILEIMRYLVGNCDPKLQFPCWISGIPVSDRPNQFLDLIFVCDMRNQFLGSDNIVIFSENYK